MGSLGGEPFHPAIIDTRNQATASAAPPTRHASTWHVTVSPDENLYFYLWARVAWSMGSPKASRAAAFEWAAEMRDPDQPDPSPSAGYPVLHDSHERVPELLPSG